MKALLTLLGCCFIALACAGIFLPVLPTTPFVLLAAACFAKSSPRFHRWLKSNRHFGPILHNWQTNRSMPKRAKLMALTTIVASGAISIYLISQLLIKLLVASILLIPIFIILRLPNSEDLIPADTQKHPN